MPVPLPLLLPQHYAPTLTQDLRRIEVARPGALFYRRGAGARRGTAGAALVGPRCGTGGDFELAVLIPELRGAGDARGGAAAGDVAFFGEAAAFGIITGMAGIMPLADPRGPPLEPPPSELPFVSRMGALLSFVFALWSFPFLNPLMSPKSPCLTLGAFCTFGGEKSGGGGGAGIDMFD